MREQPLELSYESKRKNAGSQLQSYLGKVHQLTIDLAALVSPVILLEGGQ